ncbi:hypothetical protein D3C80_1721770 [compost metagenome]
MSYRLALTSETSSPVAPAGSRDNRLIMLMPTINWSAGVLAKAVGAEVIASDAARTPAQNVGSTLM